MDKHEFLNSLLEMHEAFYDVEREHTFAGHMFEGYAEFHSESSQYVLSKKAKIWGANTHEHMFFKLVDHLDCATAQELVDIMKTQAISKVDLNPEHMTSYITLVLIADEADEKARDLIHKTSFRKNFKFGLQGWADLRLVLADLSSCRIIANKQGEELADTLQRCFERN